MYDDKIVQSENIQQNVEENNENFMDFQNNNNIQEENEDEFNDF